MLRAGFTVRALFSALATTLALVGCDDGPTGSEPLQLDGTYSLVRIDGKPLPVVFYEEDRTNFRSDYVGGTLTLGADGSFSANYVVRVISGGNRANPGDETTWPMKGTYGVSGDTIYYRSTFGVHSDATEVWGRIQSGGVVTVPTHTWKMAEYQKQ